MSNNQVKIGILMKQELQSILDVSDLTTAGYGPGLAFQKYMTKDKGIFEGFCVVENKKHFDCSYKCAWRPFSKTY